MKLQKFFDQRRHSIEIKEKRSKATRGKREGNERSMKREGNNMQQTEDYADKQDMQ
jgi:hypothetical protein